MKQLQLHTKSIHVLFGMLFLTSTMLSTQGKQNKDFFNSISDKDLEILDNEYRVLEIQRGESIARATQRSNSKQDNATNLTQPKILISLGMNCTPALQFQKKKLSEAFFPFDWCISEFESIYRALETDFHDYFKKENLKVFEIVKIGKHRIMRDVNYKIIYPHDFSLDGEPLLDYEDVRDKYYRRIDRFYQALTLGKKVYFFRTSITKEETKKLNTLIEKKFPQLNYTLVVVNDTQDFKKKWNIKHVRNFFVQGFQDAMMLDRKILKDWDTVFQDLKIIPKPKPKALSLTPLQKKRNESAQNHNKLLYTVAK